jgi:hypothetical protein
MGFEERLKFTSAGMLITSVGAVALATMMLCNGRLIYSLDDPYIGLSLGWHIGHGLYGLNEGEVASPSSSILYPVLLASFAWTSLQEWVPAVVNTLAAAGTAALFAAIAFRDGIAARPEQFHRVLFLIVVFCVAINTVGLVFTGLEHSLHAMTSVAIVFGLARVLEGEEMPAWLVPAIILAPLWRFEGLALAGGASCALLLAGRRRAGATALLMIVVTVGGFMVAMRMTGLPALPSSILMKLSLARSAETGSFHLLGFLRGVLENLYHYKQSASVLALMVLIMLHPLLRALDGARFRGPYRLTLWREFVFAGVLFGALFAHVLFGAWGWFSRYEAYAVAFGAAGAIIIWHGAIISLLGGRRPWMKTLIASAALLVLNPYYVGNTLRTPFAARSVYEQQYQMHRFAVEFYKRPVAVNDLGWVGYHNPNYVLDLWGLGSEAARKARLITKEPGWMDRLVQAHQIGVAMLYAQWFGDAIPPGWSRLGVLKGLHPSVAAAGDEVTFYSTSTEATPDALAALRRFANAIGPAAHVEIFDPPISMGTQKSR